MSDEELIKRLDEIKSKADAARGSGTAFMVLTMFLVFLLHGCDFK